MELLTAELRSRLPALYRQEHNPDPDVHAKLFCPWSNWTWFVTEGQPEGEDFLFFGYVIGLEDEWRYFVLSELESVRGPGGLTIERDLCFTPGPFSYILARFCSERGQS